MMVTLVLLTTTGGVTMGGFTIGGRTGYGTGLGTIVYDVQVLLLLIMSLLP